MADPASAMAALGLAANICQMVEYALIIVSNSREIDSSLDGVLSENRHTTVVTGNLYTASCTLSSYLDNCKTVDKASSPEGKLDVLANTLEMYRNELKTILQISIL